MSEQTMRIFTDNDVNAFLCPEAVLEATAKYLSCLGTSTSTSTPRASLGVDHSLVVGAGSTHRSVGLRAYTSNPQSNAATIAWDRQTNQVRAVHIGNRIGELRTAACNALVAERILAESRISCIGVLGSGAQARSHIMMLKSIWPEAELAIWSRRAKSSNELAKECSSSGHTVRPEHSAESVAKRADIVVCATSAAAPIISSSAFKDSAMVVAVGPKLVARHELPMDLLYRADIVTTDSPDQWRAYPSATIFDEARKSALGLGAISPRQKSEFVLHISVGVPGAELALLEALLAASSL